MYRNPLMYLHLCQFFVGDDLDRLALEGCVRNELVNVGATMAAYTRIRLVVLEV
jgi:hypothetical protein